VQTLIQSPGNLLNKDGSLAQRGYSTEPVLTYSRKHIKAPPWKVKEWDFYQISNNDFCVQMTIGHVSYAGTVAIKAFEFATGEHHELSSMLVLPFNRLHMPSSAEQGDLAYSGNGLEMSFRLQAGGRKLTCKGGGGKKAAVEIEMELIQPDRASIVMATPFDEHPSCFYYNHKINCMPAKGIARIGEREYRFEPDSAFGLLDWGRGVWPFSHRWYWGSGSTYLEGKRFGFNIGYGFGNTAAATENMLFYDGTAHKLGHVHFDLSANGYMSKKYFTSDDGRFEMEFTPIYDHITKTKLLFVDNVCHQVFGKFNGKAILDDGREIEVRDMVAFAEHAENRW